MITRLINYMILIDNLQTLFDLLSHQYQSLRYCNFYIMTISWFLIQSHYYSTRISQV